jgi:predicted ferric reductase
VPNHASARSTPSHAGNRTTTEARSATPRDAARAGEVTWRAKPRNGGGSGATAPIKWLPTAFAIVVGTGLLVALALALSQETPSTLRAPGGFFDAVARLSGIVGAYLMLVMVLLIARVPVIERSLGQDRLVRWHRLIGGWPIALIGLHIVTVTLGYAGVTHSGFVSQFWTFLFHYPDVLAALVGFLLLVIAGVTSHRSVRRKLRYETWWVVHLYIYLALTLAFFHQVASGIMFKGHPFNRWLWTALWLGGVLVVVSSRLLAPLWRNVRLQLRVENVKEIAPGVHAITLRGRGVVNLRVSGGQFFQWRFLSPGLWWHSHPYSLSAMPRPPFLRVTVKALGDQSALVAHLKRGTRVIAEGPYGAFTRHAMVTNRATLIAAGVGITPLRALVEDLPKSVHVTVIVRASTSEDLIHGDEVAAIVRARRGEFYEIIGSRRENRLTAIELRRIEPSIAQGDVFICGPSGFNKEMIQATTALGISAACVHVETFTF